MKRSRVVLALFAALSFVGPVHAEEQITLSIRGVIDRPAVFHEVAGSTLGIVMVPQSGLDAQSWTPLAQQLNAANWTALALNSTSVEDVSTGVDFLLAQGVEEVALIGGSVGGAAVLRLLNENEYNQITHAILLGTGQANAGDAVGISKLFVVAENDMFAAQTHASYAMASEPKVLVTYSGALHGQELFNSEHGAELESLILTFLGD